MNSRTKRRTIMKIKNIERVLNQILFPSFKWLQDVSINLGSPGKTKYRLTFYYSPSHILTGNDRNEIIQETISLLKMLGEDERLYEIDFMGGF